MNEEITRANDIEHLKQRAAKVAEMLDPWKDHPLLFREFRHNLKQETLILKVKNDRAEFVARNGSNELQGSLLKALNIKMPVFCTMHPPSGGFSVFGEGCVFIPPVNGRMVWSPVVKDMGGNHIVGPNEKNYGHQNLGGGSFRGPDKSRMVGPEFADTYKVGWPPAYTENELVVDCDEYYLLNVKVFISNFAGKQAKGILGFKDHSINQDLFKATFKNYGSIAWYLRNTVPSYLDWYKQKFPYTP